MRGLFRESCSLREPLIRRFAPPSPTRGEGIVRAPIHPVFGGASAGADLPELQQAPGVFHGQLAVLLFRLCQFVAAHGARGEAAVEHGGDRFPFQAGDAAGDQHAVVAQALHHGADHVDRRARQFGEGCDRLGVFSLLCERQQHRLAELAVPGQRRDEAVGGGEIAGARHLAVGAGRGQRDRAPDFLEQMRRRARQQPGAHGVGGAAQQLRALLGRQVDANAGFDRQFRIALRLLQHDGIAGRRHPRAGIGDEPPADGRIMPLQQRIGDDLGQPPASGDRQQMLLALGLRQFDQVLGAQPRRFGQHRPRDRDLVIVRQAADHVRRRLLDGGELRAQFGERDARRDVGQRAQLDGPDQPFQHVAEQLDLFAGIAVGGAQKQVGDLLQRIQMFVGGAGRDGRLDLVGNRSFQHRSS